MKIFTAAQIQRWEAATMLAQQIASLTLMQRAAAACAQWISKQVKIEEAACFHVFCGRGNNGGDGLALAALLVEDGYTVKTYLLPITDRQSADFETNLQGLKMLNAKIITLTTADDFPVLQKGDCVIDALFGTGLNRPLQGLAAQLVQHMNNSHCTVLSIDLPSGMFTDESSKHLLRVHATHTLSFQHYKTCLLLPENEEATGTVHLMDIGLDVDFATHEPAAYTVLDDKLLKTIYLPRKQFAHKGNFGHALLLAGSFGKMGAAVLCAQACLRAGAGLCTVHVPAAGVDILQISTPEAMVSTGELVNFSRYASIGIGPGLGTDDEAGALLQIVLEQQAAAKDQQKNIPIVLDADALNIFSVHPKLFAQLPTGSILTPHPKEFERLFGKTTNDFTRIALALQKAKELQCYIILKGHHSFIASPEGEGYFNSTGNAGMATGGSGDVLTGILTGLLAQGYTPLHACLLGVYLHGLAGDIAAHLHSQEAMLAGDITTCLGEAFKRLQ